MIPVTLDQVQKLAPDARLAYLRAFENADAVLSRYGVNETPLRLAHFMAQILHESGGFRLFEENLNYTTPARIRTVFGKKRFPTLKIAAQYTHRPIELARKVYNGRMGNTVTNDDGWIFRGRGPLGLTGRHNYARYGKKLCVDLTVNPGLVNDPRYLLAIPCVFWMDLGCNEPADRDDLLGVTKKVNGGLNGLEDRRKWLKKTKAVWCGEHAKQE